MSIAEQHRPYYTYADYSVWEGKWELIQGMPYAMSPAPIPAHQRVALVLSFLFELSLKKKCKKCKTYLPLDWKIDESTVVQPDLLIVCNKIEKKFLDFPPVLVVEVLSPASAVNDRGIKMEIYQQQGVKYYLIIDPQFKKIEVYQLVNNKYEPVAVNPTNFTFSLEEECEALIEFEDIWE